MRSELDAILQVLLAASEDSRVVTLDDLGLAIGTAAISADEIDRLMWHIEARDRRISSPEGGGGEARLKIVVLAARALEQELGRKPNLSEVASRADLPVELVRHALALAKVIARG